MIRVYQSFGFQHDMRKESTTYQSSLIERLLGTPFEVLISSHLF